MISHKDFYERTERLGRDVVVYWDASAVLSVLFTDQYSERAGEWVQKEGFHLLSTLSHAETCAVIARMKRENHLSETSVQPAFESLANGPWRYLNSWPEKETIRSLSDRWALKGAELWHLSVAKGLQSQLPELFLLTFDVMLKRAAEGEGLTG